MSIFKKETKPLYEEKTCSCPICGNTVKYRVYDFDQIDYYMDGQPKIPFCEYIKSFCICEHCGYIFKPNMFKNDDVISIDLNKAINSLEFKKILENQKITYEEKFLEIIQFLKHIKGNSNAIHFTELLKLWYYQDEKNESEIYSQIEKAIDENIRFENFVHTSHTTQNFLYYNDKIPTKEKKLKVRISKEEMLIDLYRQMGNFEKSYEILEYCLNNYNLKSNDSKGHFTYLMYEKELIKQKNSKHL